MLRFLGWRLLGLVAVIFAMVGGVFLLRQVIPADPARAAVGPNAPLDVVLAKREEMGLDNPLYVQFKDYLVQLAHGNLGTSIRTHGAVRTDILNALPATVELIIASIILATLLGVTY